jgi:glycolate oxidase FAD binding subunit
VLGVICEVSLKVLPVAPARATLVFECDQALAIEQLHRWTAQVLPVSASAWHGGRLHVRLAGAVAAVRAAEARLAGEAHGVALALPAADDFWLGLRDQRDPYFEQAALALADENAPADLRLWRLSVPSLRAPLALGEDVLVEWGGAQRWVLSAAPVDEVRSLALSAGGHATIFRARRRPADFLGSLSDKLMSIHKNMKQAFDPNNIFNQGKLFRAL